MDHDYDWLNANSHDSQEDNFAIAYCDYGGYQPTGKNNTPRPHPPTED